MNTPRDALSSNTKILNKTTIDVELPFPWPIGAQNLVHSEISLPDESKENIYVWIHQPDEQDEDAKTTDAVEVRLLLNKDRYKCSVVMAEKISIIIENKKIVKIQDNSPSTIDICENYFNYCAWYSDDVYLMSYLASMGVPPFNTDQSVAFALSVDDWNNEILQLMLKLVDSGHVVNLDYMGIYGDCGLFWTPEAVMAAGPLLSIITENIRMRGIDLNMDQWQEVERRVPNNMQYFSLVDCIVDQNSSEFVAKIMATVKRANLDNVKFEDLHKFCVCFEGEFLRSDVRCERLRFSYGEGEECKKYNDEIKSMGERLGWESPIYEDDYIIIVNANKNAEPFLIFK